MRRGRLDRWAWALLLVCAACEEYVPEPGENRIDGANVDAFGNRHGYVAVQLLAGIGAPLDGTKTIELRLYYGSCFEVFYREKPRWRVDGPLGRPVFDAAIVSDLCAPDGSNLAVCSVLDIRQDIPGDAKLLVEYELEGPLDGRRLRIGPLPTRGLAGCARDAAPIAGRVDAWGLAADGSLLWSAAAAGITAYQDASRELTVRAPR